MKIRSITYFLDPGWPLDEEELGRAGDLIASARPTFENAGYEVQSTRLATLPFPRRVPSLKTAEVVRFAQSLESAARKLGFDYVSIGPAIPQLPKSYQIVSHVLSATENVFISGMMTSVGNISLQAVHACADIIHRTAAISPDGFANLRFAALANVPPDAPFFPAAYHDDDMPSFALAMESADLAVEAFTSASDLDSARRKLIEALETHGRTLNTLACNEARKGSLPFGGIDFSLAPFPTEMVSLGTALECLGVPRLGLHGSLAAAAILTDTLDRARFPRAGFSGLMLPVLEDTVLARRAEEGSLTVMDLLLYSAVCGTGLDTIPLPGETTPDQLAAILLDVACLAQRLDKPLTARLMPIPGKRAGDPTGFNFAYFANSRVMAVQAEPLSGLLTGNETLALAWRR
jgi:uncharacterized protein (UPF0210 family)